MNRLVFVMLLAKDKNIPHYKAFFYRKVLLFIYFFYLFMLFERHFVVTLSVAVLKDNETRIFIIRIGGVSYAHVNDGYKIALSYTMV